MAGDEAEIEILAHIDAPARYADDLNYRTLTQAYLDFSPASRISFSSAQPTSSEEESIPRQTPLALEDAPPGTFPPFMSSLDISFGSATDNLQSPRIHVPEASQNEGSWQPPPSIIEDSMPDNTVTIPQYCSPTRILEFYLAGFENSPSVQPSSSSSPEKVIPRSPTLGVKRIRAVISIADISNETVIPSSERQPQPEPVERRDMELEPAQKAMPSTILSSLPNSSAPPSPDRADSEPPENKRRRSLPPDNPLQQLLRSTSDVGPGRVQAAEQATRTQARSLRRQSQSLDGLEIRAPEPPIGHIELEPSMLVTTALKKLAHDADLTKRFLDTKIQARPLRPFERGHWYIDCAGWPPSKRQEIWRFLKNYIGAGNAGWGIWCKRDTAFDLFRLYCWGEVVGHMYLLLYLASRRDILYRTVSFIGANEEKILTVPPRRSSSTKTAEK